MLVLTFCYNNSLKCWNMLQNQQPNLENLIKVQRLREINFKTELHYEISNVYNNLFKITS
nr:MAG TPA: hypothetical protein [Bacteriophage sp.]